MYYRILLACAALSAAPLLQAAPTETAGKANLEAGKTKAAEVCAACHGADGNSANPAWPRLAGQHAGYLAKQLADFKPDAQGVAPRPNPVMAGIVAGLSAEDITNVSAYFASLPRQRSLAEPALVALGEKIYRAGNKDTGVPACMACHGPNGSGNPAAHFPAVSGQHAAYTEATLKEFRAGTRVNDPNKMMRGATHRLTDAELQAVASYMAGLY